MKTYLDCYSCFLRHALEASRIAGLEERVQKQLLNEIMELLLSADLNETPPQLAQGIHKRIRELSGVADPYAEIKQQQNNLMLSIEDDLKRQVKTAPDPLIEAIKLAGVCNSIDMGPVRRWKDTSDLLQQLRTPSLDRFEAHQLIEDLSHSETLLYVTDNAGEIVADKILLSLLKERLALKITIAVRGGPILNDATVEDAKLTGLDRAGKVVTTGCDAPGAILSLCSRDFLEEFYSADLVIAKGQGNYEALDGCNKEDLFFLLQVKCEVVARDLDTEEGKVTLRKK